MYEPLSGEVSVYGSWRRIPEGLDIVKKHHCWKLTNSEKVHIWTDIWAPDIGTTLPTTFMSSNMKFVSQLTDENTRNWNLNTLNAIFPKTIIDKICKIRLPMIGNDQIRWTGAKNTIFSVKSAYNIPLEDSQSRNLTNNSQFPWQRLWKVKLPLKIHHFLWKCLHDCVPARDELYRFVDDIPSTCPL